MGRFNGYPSQPRSQSLLSPQRVQPMQTKFLEISGPYTEIVSGSIRSTEKVSVRPVFSEVCRPI